MTDPRIVTFGCRLNALESQAMHQLAATTGMTNTIIFNTCTVTAEAVRQARQAIRRARREAPDAKIVVTGCAAQADPQTFAAMPEVDRVLGNREKLDPARLSDDGDHLVVSDIMTAHEVAGPLIDGFDGRTRAFVQIQQGCDHRCTFCVIPYVRGPNRSVSPGRVVQQIRHLVACGYQEIVLTGVDICSFGKDGAEGLSLADLIGQILHDVPDLARLRLSTLDPAAIDEPLLAKLTSEERVMPHWHLSLQAADDLTLKRMRRRHCRADAARIIELARAARPDIVLGADLVAGFPTETDDMFDRTLSAIEEFGLTYLHVFPYSPRAGTPGALMPQVAKAVRLERAGLLRRAGEAARERFFRSRVGKVADVLVEKALLGRCAHYAPVMLDRPASPGSIVRAHIAGANDDALVGALMA